MSKYFNLDYNQSDGYFIYIGERGYGKTINTLPRLVEFLFGGTCIYHYDPYSMIHHYLIKNDDIGFMDMEVTNECFTYENIGERIISMCEEYDNYMRIKYDNYVTKEGDLK